MNKDVTNISPRSIASSDIDTHTAIAHLFYLDNTLRNPYGPFALTPLLITPDTSLLITPDTSCISWSALDVNNNGSALDVNNHHASWRIHPVTPRFGLLHRTRIYASEHSTNAIILHNYMRQLANNNQDQ